MEQRPKLNKMYPRGRKVSDRATGVENEILVWLASIMYQDYCIILLFIYLLFFFILPILFYF